MWFMANSFPWQNVVSGLPALSPGSGVVGRQLPHPSQNWGRVVPHKDSEGRSDQMAPSFPLSVDTTGPQREISEGRLASVRTPQKGSKRGLWTRMCPGEFQLATC